jgi:hypothetical protein
MKYWIDTEFIEDGHTIELVSIGMVCEDGREFYAENSEANLSRANEWVRENVVTKLWSRQADKRDANRWIRDGGTGGLLTRTQIARELIRFCDAQLYGWPEFWGYYADYDWVVLCQLFGTMMQLPRGWPMYCRDIKQWADMLGNPKLPAEGKDEHNALADAHWNKRAWDFLNSYA